jgi:hypothetical protein
MLAREAGEDRHSVEKEQKRECTDFFKTPKTTTPPAIDHHDRTALIMPWARFTTARGH